MPATVLRALDGSSTLDCDLRFEDIEGPGDWLSPFSLAGGYSQRQERIMIYAYYDQLVESTYLLRARRVLE